MAETVIRPGGLPAERSTLAPTKTPPSLRGDFALGSVNIGAGIEGDFGAESSRVPFLSIGQKTSDIVEDHPEALGKVIYAGRHIVPTPVTIIFYGARQYYRQNLLFDRNSRPRSYATKEEVLNAGGNLDRFIKAGVDENNYVPELVAKVVLMSKAKGKDAWANADDIMSYPGENGSLVVPILWTLRGVAYGQVVPQLRMIDRALREEGKEIAYAKFNLSVVKQTFTSNSTFVPILDRLADDNSAEVVQILHNIFDV